MQESQINKIIRTLDLAKSDAREKTIESLIEYILYCINEESNLLELQKLINQEFLFLLHTTEIQESVDRLIENGNLLSNNKNQIILSTERKKELSIIENQSKERESKRFENFKVDISSSFDQYLTEESLVRVWKVFTQYLYECYLEYGRNLISVFKDNTIQDTDLGDTNANNILRRNINELSSEEEVSALKKYIKIFPGKITSEDLQHLVDLANKAESFFSLGLSKEEYSVVYDKISFQWTVFVDTNFLYSILDLHSHPQTPACKAILALGDNLGIKFKYLPETLKELEYKKEEFEKNINKGLTINQIRALVKSEKLDNFTQRYLEKKLEDFDNTPHPTDVVNHAQNILKGYKIEIYRSKLQSLKSREEYLLQQESQYADHLRLIDEARVEKGLKPKAKDPEKIYHDILLREAILGFRENKSDSFSDIKHFGITLDQTLIKFDKKQNNRRNIGVSIPTFFEPMVLLKKLIKYSPLVTDDYKKAFISTISSPALEGNIQSSKTAMRSVQYFKNMGINDEQLILNCLRDELFLDKYRKLEDSPEELKNFVESEFSKQFQNLDKEKSSLQDEVNKKNTELSTTNIKNQEKQKEIEILTSKMTEISSQMILYEKSLKGLRKEIKKKPLVVTSGQLTIENESVIVEKEKLMKENQEMRTSITSLENKLTEVNNKNILWGIFFILSIIFILTTWLYFNQFAPILFDNFFLKLFFCVLWVSILIIIPLNKHWKTLIAIPLATMTIIVAIIQLLISL